MRIMLGGVPGVSWRRFFRGLTPQAQRNLELGLCESGLLLGEYMELVERAYLEAYLLREASLGWERVDLEATAQTIVAKVLGSYIRRKRLFLLLAASRGGLAWARLSGALPKEAHAVDFIGYTPFMLAGLSPSGKPKLRRRIHARIEEMKRGEG